MRRYYPPTRSDIPIGRPYSDIHLERIRAHEKHDSNGESMERRAFDHQSWLPVLTEEVGEVAKVLNDLRHGERNDWDAQTQSDLRKELIQVAAMAVAWIEAIDEDRCEAQHLNPEGGRPITCSLHAFHNGEHLDWSGLSKWA